MTDVIGNAMSVNAINHVKRKFGGEVASLEVNYTDVRPGQTGRRKYYFNFGGGYYLSLYGSSPLSMPDGKGVAISRVPTLAQEQISVLNSLYELKDLASALRRVRDHLMWARFRAGKRGTSTVDEFVASLFPWVKTLGSTGSSTIKPGAIIQSLVGADLAWKFGWKPLLEDISKVHSVLGKLSDKANELRQGWYPCIGRHTDTLEANALTVNSGTFSSNPEFKYNLSVRRKTTLTTTAGVWRKLSPMALSFPDQLKLELAREQLGLNFKNRRVWDAIPYSFVIDWVLPIQTFLDQFDGTSVPEEYVINGSKWIGRKSVTATSVVFTLLPTPSANYKVAEGGNKVLTWEGEYSSYTRSTTESWALPPLYIPQLQLPNLGQWWTGAELLITRFKSIAR